MRSRSAWLLTAALLGCGGPPPVGPPPVASFHTIVLGYSHDWTHYTCTVRASLIAELDGTHAVDSINVGAGVEDTITFTLPIGRYGARFETRWRGRPGTTWDLESEWFVEDTTVAVPGSRLIRCP